MNKKILITGSVFGIIAIILGAFAAHALKEMLPTTALQSFETGVRYQMYHAFLLLIIGSTSIINEKSKKVIFYLVLTGVLCFSGSIYGLSTSSVTNINFKSIALITPLGGVLLISAWSVLLINFLKVNSDN
ncbi:MAG: DUF423 domain-containing protein [Oceanihabitans sp.]